MRLPYLDNNREDGVRSTIGIIVSALFLVAMWLMTRG